MLKKKNKAEHMKQIFKKLGIYQAMKVSDP